METKYIIIGILFLVIVLYLFYTQKSNKLITSETKSHRLSENSDKYYPYSSGNTVSQYTDNTLLTNVNSTVLQKSTDNIVQNDAEETYKFAIQQPCDGDMGNSVCTYKYSDNIYVNEILTKELPKNTDGCSINDVEIENQKYMKQLLSQ
jgi:hypothetical protein